MLWRALGQPTRTSCRHAGKASMTFKAGHQGIATMIPAKSIEKFWRKADILAPSIDMAVEELWGRKSNTSAKYPTAKKV